MVVGSYNGEDIIVSFGGYNGRYSNEVRTDFRHVCGSVFVLLF